MSRSSANGFCVFGLCLIIFGAWLTWKPLAYYVSGAALCGLGVFVHRSGSKGSK